MLCRRYLTYAQVSSTTFKIILEDNYIFNDNQQDLNQLGYHFTKNLECERTRFLYTWNQLSVVCNLSSVEASYLDFGQ